MRYADPSDIIEILSQHPEGMTSRQITSTLFPNRVGYQYSSSLSWVKSNISNLKRKGIVCVVGIEENNHGQIRWRI